MVPDSVQTLLLHRLWVQALTVSCWPCRGRHIALDVARGLVYMHQVC